MSGDPKSFNAPDRVTLTTDDIDGLGHALLALTKELWVVRDRLAVMEAVLAKHDLDITEEIDNFQPDEELQQKLNDHGAAVVSSILNALTGLQNDAS